MKVSLSAIAAGLLFVATPAKAQLAVICPMCASEIGQYAGWTKQAADMLRQIEEARRQYQMLFSTYQALSHVTDLSSLTAAVGSPIRRYLPEASGIVSMVGQGSQMLSSAGRYRSADSIFNALPQISSTANSAARWTEEMSRREVSTANAKSLADAGLLDMQDRMAALAAAQARIGIATDATELASIQATIQTSQMNLAAHEASVNSIRLALHAEDRAERQRAEQLMAQGSSQWGDAVRGSVDALGSGQ